MCSIPAATQPWREAVRRLVPIASAFVALVVAYLLFREFRTFRYGEIHAALRLVEPRYVIAALALTGLNHVSLTLYDRAALRTLGHHLPYRRIALSSFISYAFSLNLGPIGGSAIRTRLYSLWGLGPGEIARVLAYNLAAFWLGFLTIAGVTFAVQNIRLPIGHHHISSTWVGVLFLCFVVGYFLSAYCSRSGRTAAEGASPLTGRKPGIVQIGFASLDWLCAVSVFYALLGPTPPLSFSHFLTIYLFAQVAGIISHVPGGIGVFEYVLWTLMPGGRTPALIATLILYRVVYYLMPLVCGFVAFAAYEVRKRWSRITVAAADDTIATMAPYVLGSLTFIAGIILLLSSTTPEVPSRLALLQAVIPLPILESAHFLGSLTGMALLLLSYSLFERARSAYSWSIVLLILGAIFSLLKGLDVDEAGFMILLLLLLLPARREFARDAPLLAGKPSLPWFLAVLMGVGSAVWIGLFTYKHIGYRNDLWWQFGVKDNASRFLRATVGIVVLSVVTTVIRLFRGTTVTEADGAMDRRT